VSPTRKKKRRRRAHAATTAGEGGTAREAEPAATRPSRFEIRDGVARPQPIWAPFPLGEIGMAAGLAIFVAGMLSDGQRARWLLGVAVAMLVVVVGELCVREHLAGFRSHTLLLAMLPVAILNGLAVVVAGDGWTGPPVLLADLALAGALTWLLQTRYRVAREQARAASCEREGG
jgi:hypothetical protein